VVLDQAEFPKFGHEKVDARTGCADDFGQGFLVHAPQFDVGQLIVQAETRKFQKDPGKPLFAVVENLIAEVFFPG